MRPCICHKNCGLRVFRCASYTRYKGSQRGQVFADNYFFSPAKVLRLLWRSWKAHISRLRMSIYTREADTHEKKQAIWSQELKQYKYSAYMWNQQIATM